jgi:DNA (cytosine-5)-methyltransferase 1
MMVANCSEERSFSQLKRIKNEFRTTMTQDKLCSLSLTCIQSDKLRSLSSEDVISDFAVAKTRKKMF